MFKNGGVSFIKNHWNKKDNYLLTIDNEKIPIDDIYDKIKRPLCFVVLLFLYHQYKYLQTLLMPQQQSVFMVKRMSLLCMKMFTIVNKNFKVAQHPSICLFNSEYV